MQTRTQLLFGPYRAPKCRIGGWLTCRNVGRTKVVAISDTPIPWPMTRRANGGGRPFLILCGDLVRAIQRESATAVCHHWGVTPQTVTVWRKLLGVEKNNEGTVDLNRRWAPERLQTEETTAKRLESLRSPERAAKIAAAKRGKPRPPHIQEMLRGLQKGKRRKTSEETRRKMSEAARQAWERRRAGL
jgi:hypothetical protein